MITINFDIKPAFTPERSIVLGDLITLHEVRIGVVLTVKLGIVRNGAV
jgi:hypothetical protein